MSISFRTNTATRTIARGVPLALLAALLSSCVVGPDYTTPQLFANTPLFSKSHTAAKPPRIEEWWTQFHDQTLTALINKAITSDLTVATAKAKVREARASYVQTTGSNLPSADLSTSAKRQRTGNISLDNQFQAGVDASWEIDLFGANRRAKEAAKAGLDGAEEELRGATVTLIGDIATNYINARGYQAEIALANRTTASQKTTLDLVLTKQEIGTASELDVANAKGQVATTELTVPDLRSAYSTAVHRLSVLTGQEPSALASLMSRGGSLPVAPSVSRKGIAAEAIAARPDVRVAERNLAKATANIGIAVANRYPSVSLTGSISTTGTKLGDLAKSSTISWAIGPSLSVPIFDGGKLKAAVDVAKAERDQSYLAYKAAVLTGLEDVENALVSMSEERAKFGKIQDTVNSYQSVTDLTKSSYDSGASDFLDVLTAQRSLYSAQNTAIQSKVSMALDYVTLNKALGAGWNGALDVSYPLVLDGNIGPHIPAK